MDKLIFHDFEFNPAIRQVIVGVFLASDGERRVIDCRSLVGRQELADYFNANRDAVWVSYAAMAEMKSFIWCGVDIRGSRWIDLMAEASMITHTKSAWRVPHPNLLKHLNVFHIPYGGAGDLRNEGETDSAFKDRMRDLAICQVEWSDEDFAKLAAYCELDVIPLPALYDSVATIQDHLGTSWSQAGAESRGRYELSCAVLEERGDGFPVDEAWIRRIFANRSAVRNALAKKCNEHYGHTFYVWDFNKRTYRFSHAGLEAYLLSQPFANEWRKTASGKLRDLSEEYLDDLIKENPSLADFKRTRDTLSQLNTVKLVDLIHHDDEGRAFVRPSSIPFHTVTGRNQPMVRGGFILNMPPWIRSVIKPHPGYTLIAMDWSKQEIAIAAALTNDPLFLRAYQSGDIYLTLAKMAGAVPLNATKDSHPIQRQAYKACQLGLGYGMGKDTLARSIYADLNQGSSTLRITKNEAITQASTIFNWHKRTFVDYWGYLKHKCSQAKQRGWTESLDGWIYFATSDTKHTQLMNFPVQSAGAVMLRHAMNILAEHTNLNVVCSLHDALYVYCKDEDVAETCEQLADVMELAAILTIGNGVAIQAEPTLYTSDEGYYDKRGSKVKDLIEQMLDDIEENGEPEEPPRPVSRAPRAPRATPKRKVRDLMGGEFFQMDGVTSQ